MSGHLWLPQPASIPTPAELAAYLHQQGWTQLKSDQNWAEYSKQLGEEEIALEVPQYSSARDYARVVRLLLEDMARIETREPSAILRDVKASSVDIVRLAIEGAATRDGRIPVEAGRRIYGAARDMLLAAACSVIDPRPVFAKRKPEEAMELLQRARFGQTEVGSFVLTIECFVPPRLQQTLLPGDADLDAPLERRACLKLAQALVGAEAASRESTVSGEIGPFLNRTRDGVSANLCDAVAEIIESTTAEAVRAHFSFASRRPLSVTVSQDVAFSPDVAPVLREAAARLRDEASYFGTEIIGPVVKLSSQDPSRGGETVIHSYVEGKPLRIHVTLSPNPYQTAIEAHRDGVLVRCLGDLRREGRSWVLSNPHDFHVDTGSEVE